MEKNKFNSVLAVTDIDDSLVDEAMEIKRPGRNIFKYAAIAAAAVVVLGAAIVLPKLLKHNSGEVTALIHTAAPTENAANNTPLATQSDVYGDTDSTNAPAMATIEPQAIAASATRFDTVSALAMAVSTVGYSDGNDAFSGLTSIYMPKKVPYGAELSDISVTTEAVTITYGISEEYVHDENDPNRFVFIWHRDRQLGHAEEYAGRHGSNKHCTDGVWIIPDWTGLEIYAVWEADGSCFELIVPGFYSSDSDIVGLIGITKVELSKVSEHAPAEGFEITGYMWLSENEFGYAPLTTIAYSTIYYKPEDGSEGSMLRVEGHEFLNGITDAMNEFPHVGYIFIPVFLEDTTLAEINIYDAETLEPIAMSMTLDELRNYAEHNTSNVIVDMIVVHNDGFISELNEYETTAYHCGFILECGH